MPYYKTDQTGSANRQTNKNEHTYILSEISGEVLLIGGYGAGNIGDEAILSGLFKYVSPNINTINVISHNPEETYRIHSHELPDSVTLNAITPSPTILTKHLFSSDHIVVGGGGIFSRYIGPYASKLPYYTLAGQLFQQEVHWTAIGVYPSTPSSVMRPLTLSINLSNSVSVRDPVSKSTLENAGVATVTHVPDPATRLEPDYKFGSKALQELGIDPDREVIGIAARRVMDDATNKVLQETYQKVIRGSLEDGYQVIVLPFCKHPYEKIEKDDLICQSYTKKFDDVVLPEYEHPTELLGIVSHLDFLLATRLHSMIFAHITETPFIAIEYAAKCTSLLKHYNKQEYGVKLDDLKDIDMANRVKNKRK